MTAGAHERKDGTTINATNRSRVSGRILLLPGLVTLGLMLLAVSLALGVAAVAGVARGARATADRLVSRPGPAPAGATVTESMRIETGAMDGHPGWPLYTSATGALLPGVAWTVHQDGIVVIKITSYDDGTAPLMGVQAQLYDHVRGTLGGTELVDGKTVAWVPNQQIAHTFTVPALGLNLPVPAAPTGGTVTVVARFTPERAGVFVWQCYAPCGSADSGMGGPMSTMGFMEGKVRVIA